MKSKGSAIWRGGIQDGSGEVSTGHKALDGTPYSFKTRFEGEAGTTPEELIGAAHAACFAMALSKELGDAGMTPESLETEATVTLTVGDESIAITHVHLDLKATVPDADQEKFDTAVKAAKENCPVSLVLNTEITLDSSLNG